jgi:hypothetical protein
MFPDDVQKEIWIAAGTYTPGARQHFLLVPNTSYLGGFAGTETSVHQRNVWANPTTILSGSGGALFAASGNQTISGALSFENLEFSGAASAITARMAGGSLNISASHFTGLQGNAVAVENAGNVNISDIYMRGIGGHGIYISGGSGTRNFTNITANGINRNGIAINAAGNSGITINGTNKLHSIRGSGIDISGTPGVINIYDVDLLNIDGSGIVVDVSGAPVVTINNAELQNIFVDREQTLPPDGDWNNWVLPFRTAAISIRGGSRAELRDVQIENVPNTRGISIHNVSTANIFSSEVRDIRWEGIQIGTVEQTLISDTVIENIGNIGLSGGGRDLTILNSRFENIDQREAISAAGLFTFRIEDTHFINIAARTSGNILSMHFAGNSPRTGTFTRCLFIRNGERQILSGAAIPQLFRFSADGLGSDINVIAGITFEYSEFINLWSNRQGQMYLFNRRHDLGLSSRINLTLRNSTFDFRQAPTTGLVALYGGQGSPLIHPDRLFMYGVRIYSSSNHQTPILDFSRNAGGVADAFQFWPNNYFNGTRLDSMARITGQGGNFIRLQNNAQQSMVMR